MSAAATNLSFVGDVHLDAGDPELPEFVQFLERLSQTSRQIVFLGDLFNVWIGRPELEEPHHRAITDKLAELRQRGVVVRYVEGNRDYHVADRHVGTALDSSHFDGLVARFAGHSVLAVHGDLANVADRRYRLWRRVSRSRPVWWGFQCLPSALRRALALRAERALRRSNLSFKRTFPETRVREYAEGFFRAGHDLVVLGHFHVERDLAAGPGRRIVVLPEWKGSRRYLELRPDGDVEFASG